MQFYCGSVYYFETLEMKGFMIFSDSYLQGKPNFSLTPMASMDV